LNRIREIIALYKKGEILPSEFIGKYLKKAQKNEFNSFITLNPFYEKELEEFDNKVKRGDVKGKLFGIPVAVKDNILVKDIRCTCASKILENYVAPYDATVIRKIKEQGGFIIGKTNMDEFAMGSSNEYSYFGPALNPFNRKKVPGGSSGGSAIAVANSESVISLGSDTGGSVRLPAGFCGVLGLKPTYGAVSRFGLVAFASSLDQIGPMAFHIEDLEILFEVIKGKDPLDQTSVDFEYKKEKVNFPIKIGILKDSFSEGVWGEIKSSFKELIEILEREKVGYCEEFSMETFEYAISTYYIVACAEASSNLARYDGVLYGYRKERKSLFDMYSETRKEGFGEEVKRRIILGAFVLKSGYYEEYYLKAQKARTKILKEFQENFKKYDLILTPISSTLPFNIGEKIKDPLSMYLSDVFTVSVNLAGVPALSFPFKFSKSNLPISFQAIAPFFKEYLLFEFVKRVYLILD
jgi:aspartyl-tRNA(Asn)/glutamyl-tRNA(Gln) amidotransferase subunit A